MKLPNTLQLNCILYKIKYKQINLLSNIYKIFKFKTSGVELIILAVRTPEP